MITGIYKSKATGIIKTVQNNSLIIILFSIFSAGIISGTAMLKSNSVIIEKATQLISNYIKIKNEEIFIQTFCNSLSSNIIFLLPIFVAGLCAIGIPIIFSVSFAKGLGLGFITSFYCSEFGINGLGHCVLMIFPGAVLSVLAIFIASKTTIIQSAKIFKATANGKGSIIKFSEYCKSFLIILLLFVISSFIDGTLNRLFSVVFIR